MRIVGSSDRSAFEADPIKAWHRGRALDRLLAGSAVRCKRGVTRGSHEATAQQDEARMVETARRINQR